MAQLEVVSAVIEHHTRNGSSIYVAFGVSRHSGVKLDQLPTHKFAESLEALRKVEPQVVTDDLAHLIMDAANQYGFLRASPAVLITVALKGADEAIPHTLFLSKL